MAAEELHRHEGGPLERSHMKDMVQRNALESAAYNKVAKHLDNQKKAFVRQNTRDEGEMKNLLYRLQMEQQTTLNDTDIDPGGGTGSDIDEVDGTGLRLPAGRLEQESVANPYPVTIIPRFGGNTHIKQSVSSRDTIHRPGSSKLHSRRKSIEYEDIQESLSSMTVSDLSSASAISEQTISSSYTCLPHDDHSSRDWLATPGAISSVRRMRKSVTEQAHQRILRKTSCEHSEFCAPNSNSPPSHSRNNSLKEKKKSIASESTSPKLGYAKRRGGSLKERKASTADRTDVGVQPLSRSYSVLSKVTSSEFNKKQEISCSGPCGGKSEEGLKISRKNSKKGDKQGLSRKSSNDSTSSIDGSSLASRKKTNVRRKVGIAGSAESSPVISPLARDVETFKF
ncbi:uncharacterized protein LOC123560328 [Mercenaria mercenaria]|uniref:uncharacterized protein LOC123560328 n=1 Tax=Mercenaria mercenaria TaxID=6596 RepID=UPI00234F41D5|nr:uncharacterized protein LOC123560328 [Mercenaria mercenaria]